MPGYGGPGFGYGYGGIAAVGIPFGRPYRGPPAPIVVPVAVPVRNCSPFYRGFGPGGYNRFC